MSKPETYLIAYAIKSLGNQAYLGVGRDSGSGPFNSPAEASYGDITEAQLFSTRKEALKTIEIYGNPICPAQIVEVVVREIRSDEDD